MLEQSRDTGGIASVNQLRVEIQQICDRDGVAAHNESILLLNGLEFDPVSATDLLSCDRQHRLVVSRANVFES